MTSPWVLGLISAAVAGAAFGIPWSKARRLFSRERPAKFEELRQAFSCPSFICECFEKKRPLIEAMRIDRDYWRSLSESQKVELQGLKQAES